MGSRLETNSAAVRKRIEQHTFENDEGDEYQASKFEGFPEFYRRKKIKLQNRDVERRKMNGDKPKIFRGVVAHVNGYTQPTLKEIHRLVVDHGGGFMQYLDGKTTATHIIASNLTLKKTVDFRRYRVVTPAWVVDSVAAGKLLPWDAYRLIDEGPQQNVLAVRNGSVVSQKGTHISGYRYQTENSRWADKVKDIAARLDRNENASKSLSGTYDTPNFPAGSEETQSGFSSLGGPAEADNLESSLQDLGNVSGSNISRETGDFSEQALGETSPESVDLLKTSSEPGPVKSHSPERADDIQNGHTSIQETKKELERLPSISKPMTAEEHNALLLADPKVWKSTVVNPAFLKQYYEESRLHHLSTWKAELKSKLQTLAQDQFPSECRQKRPAGSRRYILHVDFDSFFAAVSLKDHPHLADKPCVVAHGTGSGSEIASCNYPARKYGVKNGMWMKKAQELCPNLKVLPYNFKAYEATSRDFYAAILELDGIVQSVSIDEALVDVSVRCMEAGGTDGKSTNEGDTDREEVAADEMAQNLRDKVREMTKCEVSVGIGANILLAKVALRKAKPAGQYQIRPDEVLDFIGGLPVQDLPGVAWSLGKKLEEIGVRLVKDIRDLTKEKLTTALGPKTGTKLWEYSRGIDRAEVGEQTVRKSISAEINWGVRFVTQDQADEFVRSLCEELERRLLNEGVRGRQFTMKLMRKSASSPLDPPKHLGHGLCDTFNKSVALGAPTNKRDVIAREAISIMKGFGFPPGELRGIGVQMTKLESIRDAKKPQDSSQRPLQFKSPAAKVIKTLDGSIESPEKPAQVNAHPAAALAAEAGEDAKSMNLMGTQFILPSHLSVSAEIPEESRSESAGSKKDRAANDPVQRRLDFAKKPYSPSHAQIAEGSPSSSDLDTATMAALPEDVRTDMMSVYSMPSPQSERHAVSTQSSSVIRSAKLTPKKPQTPGKRERAGGRGRGHGSDKKDSNSTLIQSNLIANYPEEEVGIAAEIAEGYLAGLPEEIRREVLKRQRRERLERAGVLTLDAFWDPSEPDEEPPRLFELPPRPPRPTFTPRGLTTLPELRGAVSAWVKEFKHEKPYEEDVVALSSYLEQVVLEERDMAKAEAVAKWLDWEVEQNPESQEIWKTAVGQVKEVVQAAVERRGLGRLSL